MISFEEAYGVVMQQAKPMGSERIGLDDLCGRVLAEDIASDMDMPPFHKSAMDGFACRREDLRNVLTVIETIPAGKVPQHTLSSGQCARIMTGSMLPDGADCVIMVEQTEEAGDDRIRFTGRDTADNICRKGEDIRAGDVVVPKGTLLRPQQLAVLATVGAVSPLVYMQPRVGIISTGDELVEPHRKPELSQIRNSNACQLIFQVRTAGAKADYRGIAADTGEETETMISEALESNDVIILTGGVSMGEYDIVPDIMEKVGIDQKFRSIAIQPGRPTIFGTKGDKLCFGLPGNPVSSFVLFELLVKPLLFRLMGHDYQPLRIRLPMEADYTRRKSTRMSWLPVRITGEGGVLPVEYHGSAHINSLIDADGLISVPVGETCIKKGEKVHVRLI